MKIKIITKLSITLVLFSQLFIGCTPRQERWKKVNMFNISFKYPVVWNLINLSVHEDNEPAENWKFEIPYHESSIYVSSSEAFFSYTPEELREMESTSIHEAIDMTVIDGSSLTSKTVRICDEQYEVYQYYKDELYSEIGYFPPVYIISLNFINGDFLYDFIANLPISEEADHVEIIEQYFHMIESIECH